MCFSATAAAAAHGFQRSWNPFQRSSNPQHALGVGQLPLTTAAFCPPRHPSPLQTSDLIDTLATPRLRSAWSSGPRRRRRRRDHAVPCHACAATDTGTGSTPFCSFLLLLLFSLSLVPCPWYGRRVSISLLLALPLFLRSSSLWFERLERREHCCTTAATLGCLGRR